MAGTLAVAPSNGMDISLVSTTRDQWEIHFARFFPCPCITSPLCSSDLVPLGPSFKYRRPKGNWISSSSTAFLRLAHHRSNSDVILTVLFNGKVLVQKFALRFPSICATQSFIYALKEILKVEKGPDPEPLNTDFGSEMSSESGFSSPNKHYHRPCKKLSNTTPFGIYTPQMPTSSKSEGERHSGTQVKETTPGHKFNASFQLFLPVLPHY